MPGDDAVAKLGIEHLQVHEVPWRAEVGEGQVEAGGLVQPRNEFGLTKCPFSRLYSSLR